MIVNSGSLEETTKEEIVDIYAPEMEDMENGIEYEDLPDRSGKKKKTRSTDYGKIAKAIGSITSQNVKVSLVDINKSQFSFDADEENNEILFGLKGVNRINDDMINQIIAGRPYKSIKDFMNRCPIKKDAMISLIKAGAFDRTDSDWAQVICPQSPRVAIMGYYLNSIYGEKKELNLRNFNKLLEDGMIPDSLSFQATTFRYNKYLKENCKFKDYYTLENGAYDFYQQNFDTDILLFEDNKVLLDQKKWDKIYKKVMEEAKNWLKENQQTMLNLVNTKAFSELWNKQASGTVSAWEMQSVCFYYHDHELANVDKVKYGIADFDELPSEPEVAYYFKRGNGNIPIFKTTKIVGTVLNKNDKNSSITLLTLNGVATVKFTKEYYANYARQISAIQPDGSKKVIEKSWFTRGTKVLVTGFRREDTFVAKSYKHTPTHQLYIIDDINGKDITIRHERKGIEE